MRGSSETILFCKDGMGPVAYRCLHDFEQYLSYERVFFLLHIVCTEKAAGATDDFRQIRGERGRGETPGKCRMRGRKIQSSCDNGLLLQECLLLALCLNSLPDHKGFILALIGFFTNIICLELVQRLLKKLDTHCIKTPPMCLMFISEFPDSILQNAVTQTYLLYWKQDNDFRCTWCDMLFILPCGVIHVSISSENKGYKASSSCE